MELLKKFIQLNDEGWIVGANDYPEEGIDTIEVLIPKNVYDDFRNYVYRDGEFIFLKSETDLQYEIANLKEKLSETDYISSKMSDKFVEATSIGDLLSIFAEFKTKYASTISQRQVWRNEINKLNDELDKRR